MELLESSANQQLAPLATVRSKGDHDHVVESNDNEKEEEEDAVEAPPPNNARCAVEVGRHHVAVDKWAIDLPHLLVSTNLTLEKFHVLKWKEIFQFTKLMAAPCFRRVRLAGDDRALYECFYRSFPHEMVTKARFVGVVRAVFGVEEDVGVKSKLSRDQVDLCRHLEKMQYTFELSTENVLMVNWRLLLIGIHMFQQPLLSFREHLAWGFRVFHSFGFLDRLTDSTAVKASDLASMLAQLMRNQATTRLVSERFRQAQVLEPTGSLTPANLRQRMSSTRVTHRRFQELLALAPMRTLFDPATEHTTILEELATPIYRDFVFKKRKKASDRKKIDRLRYYHRTKRLRHAYYLWREKARVLKRTRVLMVAAFERLARVQRGHAFARMKQHAIHSWAATELQRMVRGMAGRRRADQKWQLLEAAIKVQRAFRTRSYFVQFLQDSRRRNRAAVRIQRIFRGWQGRIAAKKILLVFFYSEMDKIQKERDAFYGFVRDEMANRIQRLFKRLLMRAREKRAAQEAKERDRVEMEMLEQASEATRSLRRYKQELTAKYDKLRRDFEYKKSRQQIDKVEKNKVIRLRRQRQWDAFKQQKLDSKDRFKRESADTYNALKSQWEFTILDRVKRKKIFLSQVIELDDPGEWKPLQRQLKALVADRERQLMAKYKQANVAMPSKQDVKSCAIVDIVDDEVEKERQQAEAEWLQAEEDFVAQLEAKEEERNFQENAEERQRREKSAVLVQSAVRMYAAKRQLQDEIKRCFVKEFNTSTQLCMYRNTYSSTDKPSARKPYGLASQDDLEYADQWVLIDDPVVGHPFFFHPKRIVQSWEKPDDCQCCQNLPNSTTTHVAFGAFWNPQDDSYLCQGCYDTMRIESGDASSFQADQFYPYDGSKPGGY